MLATPQTRDEVAERILDNVGSNPRIGADAALAGDVARMVVLLPDREGVASVEATVRDIVSEERLGARAELLPDAAYADHVRRAVAQHARIGHIEHLIPVRFPRLRIYRLVVRVEALSPCRRRLEHPSNVQEIRRVDLQVSAAEVVRRSHFEGAHEIDGERGRLSGKALLSGDVLVVTL